MAKKTKYNFLKLILVYVFIIFISLLASINLNQITKKGEAGVLGVSTDTNTYEFWSDFLDKNPKYVPGWIEIGRIDKVNKIDPNYFIK